MDTARRSRRTSARIYSLDYMRILAFCGVVLLHTVTPDGELSIFLNILSRFSVPFFFMIAGFFFKEEQPLIPKLNSLVRIGLIGGIVYCALGLIGITPWFSTLCAAENMGVELVNQISSFLLWNEFPPAYPLWFVFAMIYVYIIIGFLVRIGLSKSSIVSFSLGLFAARTILGEVLGVMDAQDVVLRSWLFLGLPCFSIGIALKQFWSKLADIKSTTLLAVITIGVLISTLEYRLFGLQECYIGMLFSTAAVILFCCKHPFRSSTSSKISRYVTGGRFCLIAYLIHYAVICVLSLFQNWAQLFSGNTYQMVCYAGTVSLSLAIALVTSFYKVKKTCSRKSSALTKLA